MTAKELKKLSRLELLELLLKATEENENLKEKIEQLEIENDTARRIEALHETACSLASSLETANTLTGVLKVTALGGVEPQRLRDTEAEEAPSPKVPRKPRSDKNLYCSLLNFFVNHREALYILPADLREDVSERIAVLLERAKNK